jgi:predicted nucleic acid-binding Zn ribbon protein
MPTYEFRCPDGTIVERIFKMSEVPDSIPSPNGDGVAVRIISGGADLIFKGSGFYITDYGKDGKRDLRDKATESKKEGDKAAKGESKSEAKAESSSAAKSEPKPEKSAAPEKASGSKPKADSPSTGKSE